MRMGRPEVTKKPNKPLTCDDAKRNPQKPPAQAPDLRLNTAYNLGRNPLVDTPMGGVLQSWNTHAERWTSMPLPRLLTVSETEERLGVSRATVYRLIDRGHLHRVKVGSGTRITETSVLGVTRQDLLTVPQVAEYLNVSRSTIYRLIREGLLHRAQAGGKVRVSEDSLMAYLGHVRRSQ